MFEQLVETHQLFERDVDSLSELWTPKNLEQSGFHNLFTMV